MIHRVRPPDSCPESLKPDLHPAQPNPAPVVGRRGRRASSSSAGAKELAKVRQWFADRVANPQLERPKFEAYGGDDVKKALETIFERKCAYCESLYAAQQPVDVEHWRPKARIEGEPKEIGGYEWLAMRWENLLPSCIDCNRARNQDIPDPDNPGKWKTIVVGKLDQFPIDPAFPRWRFGVAEDQVTEKPLLLNPCEAKDDPGKFFDFTEEGVLLPKVGLSAADRLRATESIRVYALNRRNLVDERRRHVLRLELTFKLVSALFKMSADPDLKAEYRTTASTLVAESLDYLRKSTLPNVPYSQFIAARVKRFLAEDLGVS